MKKALFTIVLITLFLISGCTQTAKDSPTAQELANISNVKALINEGWNMGSTDIVDKLVSPDCINYLNGVENESKGANVIKQNIDLLASTYDDFKVTIID